MRSLINSQTGEKRFGQPLNWPVGLKVLLTFSCCFLLFLPLLNGQSIELKSSAEKVQEGEILRLSYSVRGQRVEEFSMEKPDGFVLLSGPNQVQQTIITNGRMNVNLEVSYDLQAEEVGIHSIGAARAVVDGKRINVNPKRIVVEAAQARTADIPKEAEVAVQINLPKDTLYVGERAMLNVSLLRNPQREIYTYTILKSLDLDGLRSDGLRKFYAFERQANINGAPYSEQILFANSVYATQPGQYKLDNFKLRAHIIDGRVRQRSFRIAPPVRPVELQAEPKTVVVLPLPPGAPSDFMGAVGSWEFEWLGDTLYQISSADALQFQLRIRGEGDIARVEAPAFDLPQGWRQYPPRLLAERADETEAGLFFERVYEYTLAVDQPGQYELQPALSWFSTEDEAYRSWQGPKVVVAVNLAAGAASNKAATLADKGNAKASELVMSTLKPIAWKQKPWALSSWFWWVVAAIPLVMLLMQPWFWRQASLSIASFQRKDAKLRSPDVLSEGRRRLKAAREAIEQPDSFMQELAIAMDSYADQRLGLAASRRSAEDIQAAFDQQNQTEKGRNFREAMELLDRGRFGGGNSKAERELILEKLEIVFS